MLSTLTPVLPVDEIERCLPFWADRLGFRVTVEVPDGDRLGFVLLRRDAVEVMLQTRASLVDDMPAVAAVAGRGAVLYLGVEDLDPFLPLLEGVEVVTRERRTSHGAREVGVRSPGGHVVILAQREGR